MSIKLQILKRTNIFNFRSIIFIIIFISIILPLNSCRDKEKEGGFGFDDPPPICPYNDPICHPSGKVIGFNYVPLREIIYYNGTQNPRQAQYIYDREKAGFYLINSDGKNQRRILPYLLNCPSWSPDGKWITFSARDIFKMPFDEDRFDTILITKLTNTNHDFYPTWSPNSKLIAYDNTDCGSAVTPIPPNSCGVLIMDSTGNNKIFVQQARRFPFWGRSNDTIYYYGMYYYDLVNKRETKFFDNVKLGFTLTGIPSFNPQKNKIFLLGRYTYVPGKIKLYSVEPTGKNFVLVSDETMTNFTFTRDGRIIYVHYSYETIDEGIGALWIMDQDGSNNQQFTYNNFIRSYQ
jgi:hypothetical protein